MGSQRKINTTKTNKEEEEEEDHRASNNIKSQPPSKEEEEDHVGQGELYSPAHAVNNNKEQQQQQQQEKIKNTNYVTDLNETVAETGAGGGGGGRGGGEGGNMRLVEEIARHFGVVKDRALEKLAAAAAVNKYSIQAETLGNARHFLETLVKDVRAAAHGLTKDALDRVKTHLLHTLPSLSPAIATKMVGDEANKASGEGEGEEEEEEEQDKGKQRRQPRVSPTSSLFSWLKPSARL